jgi:hypothetical protein
MAVYLDAIGWAQAMDRAQVRRRAAEEVDTERVEDRVIGALGKVRASADSYMAIGSCPDEA